MKTMDFGSNDEPMVKKKSNTRNLKIALGLAAIILIPAVGSTLAGSININSGSAPISFGQGVVQATACAPALTLTPATAFSNVTTGGFFKLATITLANISDACNGKTLTVEAFGDNSATALTVATGTSTTSLSFTHVIASSACGTPILLQAGNETIACSNYSSGTSTETITLVTVLDASTIYKFTVQES